MNVSKYVVQGLGIVALGLAAPAAAEPILLDSGSIGNSYSLTFDGFVNGGPSIDGVGSALSLTLTGVQHGTYTFDYNLTNTGATGDSVRARVSSFAFNTNPHIVSASGTGTYGFTNRRSNYPNGIGKVDVCFQAKRTGSCAGGGSGGVFDGDSGTGTLSLNFGTAPSTLKLDDFFVRYQAISGVNGVTSASGRRTFVTSSGGGSSGGGSSGGTPVPEPGMMLLFGLAVVGLVFGTRRPRSQKAEAKGRLTYA